MDRRQIKTRDAIFQALITVGEIIDLANVGRATFYAHFETKDFLLKELCEELFAHVFEAETGSAAAHSHIFDCEAPDSVFLHLLQHLRKNDNHILELLSGQSNELFLLYFKENLKELVKGQLSGMKMEKPAALPEDFWVNHISSVFVETVRWWIDHNLDESPEEINEYFLQVI